METIFSHINNKLRQYRYLSVFLLCLLLLSGCADNKVSFTEGLIDYMANNESPLYGVEENPSIPQEEFENELMEWVNCSTYYHLSDYMTNYEGQNVKYLVFKNHRSPAVGMACQEFTILWIPLEGGSSCHSTVRFYENGKTLYSMPVGSFGEDLIDAEFSEKDRMVQWMFESPDMFGDGAEFWYQGELFVDTPGLPEKSDFAEKEELIQQIFTEVQDRYFEKNDTTVDYAAVYIQNFGKEDAETTILCVYNGDIDNSWICTYDFVEMEFYGLIEYTEYAENIRENDEIAVRILNQLLKISQSPIVKRYEFDWR